MKNIKDIQDIFRDVFKISSPEDQQHETELWVFISFYTSTYEH